MDDERPFPAPLTPFANGQPPLSGPFRWPTPPFAAYPASPLQWLPEPCEIEGLNGKLIRGKLLELQPEALQAVVQVPGARSSLVLRFSQFRRLLLTTPLQPVPVPSADPHAAMLEHRHESDWRLQLPDGGSATGRTVGHVETAAGLFLFPPADAEGAVQRLFLPKQAYVAVELGPRIGEVLIEQNAVTAAQVEAVADEQHRLRQRKLGDILINRQIVEPDQLMSALDQQAKMPMVRIGEALIALGLITDDQLGEALERQREDRSVPLGELLVRSGRVSRADLQNALARKMGYPFVDVASFPAEVEAVRRLPYAVATRLNTLPLLWRSGRLMVALEDPSRRDVIEELEFAAQGKVVPALADGTALGRAIDTLYERFGMTGSGSRPSFHADDGIEFDLQDAGKLLESLERQQNEREEREDDEPLIEQSDNQLVRLINTMIIDAHSQRASDIHIETQPGREKVKVRFRRDGVLKPYLELPHTYRAAMVARLKIMCDLDISERRKPQDGKINFAKFSPQHKLELRVATIPTANGLEDVVMRLLASARPLPLKSLGLSERNLQRLTESIERPYGMVLCVGPTGSGKTTTLHSALGHINKPERKIWTAEDPVEITQAGLRQVQVNPKIDWTFAKALRAFLRADPDVIMVGEIRDEETAQTAVEASLTGHLVMSTLHTNSAPETVTRLLDMGLDPFNFGDSLLAVLAQRLVRRLCAKCRVAEPASDTQVEELMADYLHVFPDASVRPTEDALRTEWLGRFGQNGRLQHFHSPGCPDCEGTGERGRVGLHELMVVSRPLRRMIHQREGVEALLRQGMAEGMRSLRQDGIEKVLSGLTTIDEVRATSNA
ncbi:ATPase, T2SS/T4P/T4SS family [Aquabacterium sp. J223]|uniref:GspE/PulE family protein n=1 Tax=Aquabacterium sp. J223 TaxID=2898431 RepID=UPI003917207C